MLMPPAPPAELRHHCPGQESELGHPQGPGAQRVQQDRAAAAESERRRAEVEISKLKADVRTMADELERSRAESRSASDEKRELEDRARAIAGLWR